MNLLRHDFRMTIRIGSLILLVAMAALVPRAAAQTTCIEAGGLCFEAPPGYALEYVENDGPVPSSVLLMKGGHAELAKKLPVRKLSDMYIDDWLSHDAYRFLKVRMIDLPPTDAARADEDVAASFHRGFASRWGENAFAIYDGERGIGRSMNVAGAVVAMHIKRCGTKLVIVEAMDIVEFLKLSNADYAGSNASDIEQRWRNLKDVANADDATQVIANICKAADKGGG